VRDRRNPGNTHIGFVERNPGYARAIESLKEELEAVDWYNQRVDACKDPTFSKELRDYLFTDKPLAHE
jgi:hypothetical protein